MDWTVGPQPRSHGHGMLSVMSRIPLRTLMIKTA